MARFFSDERSLIGRNFSVDEAGMFGLDKSCVSLLLNYNLVSRDWAMLLT